MAPTEQSPSNLSYGTYNSHVSEKKSQLPKIILIVLGVIVLLIAALMIQNAVTSGPKNDFMKLVAEQDSLYTFATSQQSNIQNNDLKKINSDVQILTLSVSSKLHGLLSEDFGLTDLTSDIVIAVTDTTSDAKLKEASLAGRYDTVYRTLLLNKVVHVIETIQIARDKASTKNGQQKLDNALTTLQSLQTQLSNLSL